MSNESGGAHRPPGSDAATDAEAAKQEEQPIPVENTETWLSPEPMSVSVVNVVRGGTVFLGDLAGAAPVGRTTSSVAEEKSTRSGPSMFHHRRTSPRSVCCAASI
jgi:hypothetical protein